MLFRSNELAEVMNIIKHENLNVINTRFEEKCNLIFSVRKSEFEKVIKIFKNIYGVILKNHEK